MDGSVSMSDFLKQKNTDKGYTTSGTDEEYGWAQEYLKHKKEEDEIGEKKNLYANNLKNAMGEASTLDFGVNGKVTWKADKNGKRALKVSLK